MNSAGTSLGLIETVAGTLHIEGRSQPFRYLLTQARATAPKGKSCLYVIYRKVFGLFH